MKDQRKTKAQLIKELEALRQQVADLQAVTSEHQQLEEGLCQSEERYRDLFENANDALATFTLDGTLTAVNRGLEILTGWSREDLIGQDYRKITPLAVMALTEERTRRALVGEKLPSTFEAGFVCKDGRVVPVEARTRFIRDKEGRPIGLQTTARDIAARKRAEEALRESEQRYRHLFETANDGISIISRDGCFLEVNQKLAEFTGLSREEIIGKTTELFLPGGFAQSLERIEQTIQEGKLGPFELEITTPLGKKIGSFTASVYYESGVPVGVMNIVRDITERHRRRQEREALYQLAHDLVRASDVPTIADHLFRQTKRLLGPDYASLMLANATGTELRRVAVSGMDNQVFHQERVDVATELAPATVVFQQRTSLVIPDVASSTFMSPRIREQYGFLRGAWFVPLMSGTNAIGTFCVAYATSRDATPEDLRLLQLLSDEAALALERVRLAEDLREKEEQLRTVVSHAPIALWASDRSGIFTLLEGKGLEALGCKSGEYVGQSIFDVYRDVPRALEDTRRALAGETFTATGEVAGSVFESWYSPLRDREGNIVGTVGVATDITERRQTEEALQQSEQKYHTLVDRIRDGVFIIPDGKVQFCNDALASMLGYTVDELTGRDMREIVAPEDVELVMDRYRRRLAGEAIPQCYEFHMLHKDKSTRIPVELSVTLVTSQGKPATMGTIRDITERKRTEAALRTSQERQSLILRSLPMAFYTAEAYGDSGAMWVSDQIDRISGFSPQRFVETPHFWASRLHPDDRERVLEANRTALDTGALVTEYRWQCADGTYHWFLDRATLICDEAGAPKEVIGAWLDVTERKRTEEALRESEEYFRSLIEYGSDLIAVLTAEGILRYVSPSHERVLGYAAEELIGQDAFAFVHPDDLPDLLETFASGIHTPGAAIFRFRHRDGSWHTFESIGQNLLDNPAVRGVIVNSRDITARKQAEEALREREERLAAIFATTPDYIYLTDTEGHIVDANPALLRRTGLSLERLRQMHFMDFFAGEDQSEVTQAFEQLRRGQQIQGLEVRARNSLGEVFEYEINAAPLKEHEEVTAILSVARDITERKRVEEALQASEERYRNLFENANDAIVIVDLNRTIVNMNRAMEQLLGWSREELVGQNNYKVLTSAGIALAEERERRIQNREKIPSIFEHEFVRKDGSKVLVEGRTRFVRDRAGKPIGFQGIYRDITERKRAEEALHESEQRYRAISELISDYAYAARIEPDDTYTVEWFTETFTHVTGFTFGKEPYSADTWRIVHPDDVPIVRKRRQKLLAGQIDVGEFRIVRKDGEVRWIREYGKPIWDEGQGRVVRLYFAGHDITDHRRMEESLRESEQRYRGLVESQQDLIVRVDPQERFTFVNDAYCKKFAKQREELIGASFMPLVHEDDQAATLEAMKGLEVPPYRVSVEQRALTAEGWRWLAWEDYAVRDEHGRIIEIQAVGRDITERRRAEEALRASEERYRTILEHMEDCYYELDLAGNLTAFNDSLCRALGYARDEMGGMNYRQYMDQDNRRKMYRLSNDIYKTGKPARLTEWEVIRKDGERRSFEGSVSLVWNASGQPVRFRGIIRDVTERKQAEEEKQKLQEQLFQARKLEALGTLAGGVAHDFNNILSAIMGFTELAMDEVLEGTVVRHDLEEVLKASRRAKVLVQQILTFSRPHQQTPEPIQPQPVVEEVLTFLQASLPETIEVRRHIDKTAGPVGISPTQLQQILANLCANATQALKERSGVLEVSLQQIQVKDVLVRTQNNLKPGPHIQLTVSDTGCGMTSAVQERIFEPFFTTRPVGEGNGLGLAIVHGIVTGHGGGITVESTPGKGTTFHVYLPVSENDVAPENILPYSPSPVRGDSGDEKGAPSDTTHFGY